MTDEELARTKRHEEMVEALRESEDTVRAPAALLAMPLRRVCGGGDRGTRTPGLSVANAALSQLSYIPTGAV